MLTQDLLQTSKKGINVVEGVQTIEATRGIIGYCSGEVAGSYPKGGLTPANVEKILNAWHELTAAAIGKAGGNESHHLLICGTSHLMHEPRGVTI